MSTEPVISFSLRLPKRLHELICERAKHNRRSRAQEILLIMERELLGSKGAPAAEEALRT